MSRKRTCAISSWISFLTSAGIPVRVDIFATEMFSTVLSAVEIKPAFNYPTLAECYKVVALDAANKLSA